MAMQPADALRQHIHRCKVGDQQVGINVQALRQCLGADQHQATCVLALFAEAALDLGIQADAVGAGEAAVVKRGDSIELEQQLRVGIQRMQRTRRRHRVAHQVAHHQMPGLNS
jgi:hypothetical protein